MAAPWTSNSCLAASAAVGRACMAVIGITHGAGVCDARVEDGGWRMEGGGWRVEEGVAGGGWSIVDPAGAEIIPVEQRIKDHVELRVVLPPVDRVIRKE